MKKIAAVAIAALENKQKSLSALGWGNDYHDLYMCWAEMRRQNGGEIYSKSEWRDTVVSLISDLIDHYKSGSNERYHSWETANLKVSMHVMCGFKRCPKWETDVCVSIVDHT